MISLYNDESFFRSVFSAEQGKVSDVVYGSSSNIIYEVAEITPSASDNGKNDEISALIPDGSNGFRTWITSQKSYRDNTQKFMETYSEMFSYSGE